MNASIPPLLQALCDDAAMFPPGNAPQAEALTAHAAHRRSAHADLVGPFVFPSNRLDELDDVGPLSLALTVPEGAVAVGRALSTAAEHDDVTVVAVEIGPTAGDEHGAQLVRARIPGAVAGYAEVPRSADTSHYLRAVADAGLYAKFRTGGVRAELYPDAHELAAFIIAAIEASVAFKATAGLHHAIRNTDPHTGFEQHGFLNLLLATSLALDGAAVTDLARVLDDRNAETIAAALTSLSAERARDVRAAFHSFGTCSIVEPLNDLIDLGLVPAELRPAAAPHLSRGTDA
ncbi:hypothetical protein [Nocardia sp. CA-290969]|uniref:hypothetical protein n=1 Tax=Nocardia sp. CA-290969 TaxID=3239986 RepID=UPI003D8A2E43